MHKCCQFIVSFAFLVSSSAFAQIERVSVSTNAEQGNAGSTNPSITADGRYVAFDSSASNLVAADTNGLLDVFVYDRQLRKTERMSISSTGEQADHTSKNPSISADGRFVVFISRASNLVVADTNGLLDVFIRDRELQITQRISVSTFGDQADAHSYNPSISADGRYVSFYSKASNLVASDTNNVHDVFIHDRQLQTTRRVSVSSSGEQGNRRSYSSSISADGRYLAFASDASNLVIADSNAQSDIFVHDQELGTTERVSVSSSGEQANKFSFSHFISADSRYVVFDSSASNLVVNDTNGVPDIFVHDRALKTTMRVSVSSSGVQARGAGSFRPSISIDGRYVSFTSAASNLVAADINGVVDVFVHDLEIKKTERINPADLGMQINAELQYPVISGNGKFIAFHTYASNLIEDDTNERRDVFVADNPLNSDNDLVVVEKLINNAVRETPATAAQLVAGTQYRQSFKVTNTSPSRIYQVQVFESGNLVCNFYALNPGQSRQGCDTFRPVLEGDQYVNVVVNAKDSVSAESLTSDTDAYYTGSINATGKLRVTHKINNNSADSADSALTLNSTLATVSFKIENTGEIELYRVKTYHDPVMPVNSGWAQQCVIGPLKPGQVRYCKRDIELSESGLNETTGRTQAANAINSATEVINASNPTYFIVP